METYSLTHSLLSGLRKDCIGFYPDEQQNIDESFDLLEHEYASIDGFSDVSAIGKALETSLITNQAFYPSSVLCSRTKDNLPAFFNFLFRRIFSCADRKPLVSYDPKSGYVVIRDQIWDGDVTHHGQQTCDAWYTWCISNKAIRNELSGYAQAVLLARQALLLCSKATDVKVIADEETEIEAFKLRITAKKEVSLPSGLLHIARRDLRSLLEEDGKPHPSLVQWIEDPFGVHGPGAVFDGSGYKDKWRQGAYFGRFDLINRTNHRFLPDDESEGRSHSRLSVVPKDFRKHRLICIEQKELMFAQQGLRRVLEDLLARDPHYSLIMSTNNQDRNFRRSRSFEKYSSIDLSDASDHLSLGLAKLLFPKWFYKTLIRLRASRIMLPSEEYVDSYSTLFTMGNALCFPVETLVFSTLVSAALQYYSGLSAKETEDCMSVFGDDILVRSEHYHKVIRVLGDSGFVPNEDKCCYATVARESCGSWYYGSFDVIITRIKCTQKVCTDRDWVASLQVAINLSNNGLVSTAMGLLATLDHYYPVPYGYYGLPSNPLGSIHASEKRNTVLRYNSQLQRMEFFCPTTKCQKLSRLDGESGLYAYFTGQSSNVFSTELETERSWVALD